ncbi:hypothetical protein M8C21_032826, partial [Ambrosia artemisiifolia]
NQLSKHHVDDKKQLSNGDLHHRVADLELRRVKLGALTITSDMLVYRQSYLIIINTTQIYTRHRTQKNKIREQGNKKAMEISCLRLWKLCQK